MKIGQTSLIVFLSRLLGSALGFLATLYFARELGAEVIGLYALVITVVGWLALVADIGIGSATVKRISEGAEQGAYLSASVLLTVGLAIVVSIAVIFGQPFLESYITEFDEYVAISVIWFIVALIFTRLFRNTIRRVLKGERKVHIVGLLDPVKVGGQSLIQIGLVFAGYGLLGMLVGYILGGIIVGIVGLIWVKTRPSIPRRKHLKSLYEYARFSWLGKLRSRVFSEVDILLLGVFVPTSLVGVYSIAWSLANFLSLFGEAITQTMFPEISHTSAQESDQAAAGMVEDALAYTGLFAIPGLVGGVLLGDRLLRLYGEAFVEGTAVLGLLILAVIIYSYQKQLINGLGGLDRPDLAFRVNAVFIVLNGTLNIVLIQAYGIEGAAVATVISAGIALLLSYYMLVQLISFELPWRQFTAQWLAAGIMGLGLYTGRTFNERAAIIEHNAIFVVGFVCIGAGIYFLALLALSSHFRQTIVRNLPERVR